MATIERLPVSAFTWDQQQQQQQQPVFSNYHHSTPTNNNNKPMVHSQLHFNMDPSTHMAVQNHIRKPRPIVIEKLLPPSHQQVIKSVPENLFQPPPTILSSDRLALATQLARLDVKKLRTMIPSTETVSTNEVKLSKYNDKKRKKADERAIKKPSKPDQKPPRKEFVFSLYPDQIMNSKDTQTASLQENKPFKIKDIIAEHGSKLDRERQRLQKDLLNYSSTLDQVVQRLRSCNEYEEKITDPDLLKERERNQLRAGEQQIRSSRMLYMLHHKVQDVVKQKTRLNNTIRPTKKSQYQNSLASAQRAAVRALQVFVNQAPLFYDTSGKLPASYKELGSLIQQLTMLSTEISCGGSGKAADEALRIIENMLLSVEQATTKNSQTTSKTKNLAIPKPKIPPKQQQTSVSKPKKANTKANYLDQHIDWLKQKADQLNIQSIIEEDEETPERQSTLRHAVESLGGMSNKPTTKSHLNGDDKNIVKKKKTKPGVLLPNALKVKKNKSHPEVEITKNRLKPATRPYHVQLVKKFSDPTILSKIRERPSIHKQSTKPTVTSSPPKKHPTARERDKEIIREAKQKKSPRSPTRVTRSPPQLFYNDPPSPCSTGSFFTSSLASRQSPRTERSSVRKAMPFMQKEIERQHWLDRTKASQLKKLELMGKKNSKEYKQLRKEFEKSHHLVAEAEEMIRNKLQPLLEKAEEIADEEAKREEDYKNSINKRLADVASQKALSEGERLAEYILDDLLLEAAVDFQRIEADKEAEYEAAFMSERPTLESIEQRLRTFEVEEEKIRRHWKSCNYADVTQNSNQANYDPSMRSVMFTAVKKERRQPPSLPSEDESDDFGHVNTVHLSSAALHSIFTHQERYEEYTKKRHERLGTFQPDILFEELSEELFDELFQDVAMELDGNCNDYVNELYEGEFLQNS